MDVSPEVGVFDEKAFERAMERNADNALSLLAHVTGATDERLRALARRFAGRFVLDLARNGPPRARGVGKLRARSAAVAQGDLDIDASLEVLHEANARGRAPTLDDLVVSEWSRPHTALCLVVDRSGSMGGERLASAGLAAAAAAWRAPADYSVLAFSADVVAVKSQNTPRPTEAVVDDVLGLYGHGPTDLGFALTEARIQLDRSPAKRRITVLLSDCDSTIGDDPTVAARLLDQLLIIAPADNREDAEVFAGAVGAQLALLDGPSGIPAAFAQLLGP